MRLFYGIIAVFLTSEICVNAGTVYKTIIKNGTGPTPQPDQTVVVHYTGKLQSGEQFDSSRDRNEPFKFKLGAGEVIRGWDAGVSSMRVGERAELEIAPEDGYGAEGYPPVIPPSATLLFDIELLAIEGVTPMPLQPAFGGVTDVLTSSSASSSTGNGQSQDGFITTNMFDNQGFSSTGQNSNSGQGFVGMDASSSQSFTPADFSLSGSSGTAGTASSSNSVPSLADAFSVSMSGKGSTSSSSNQRSASGMDGLFDMGRGNANDAIFGGSSGVGQMSMTDNRGQSTDNTFLDTRIPGFDMSSAGGTDFNFDSTSGGGGNQASNLQGQFGSPGRTGDTSLLSTQFGGGSSSQIGSDTSRPNMDIGIRQGFGQSFANSRIGSRDFGRSMSTSSDRFGGSTRDSSNFRPFGLDRGSASEPGIGARMTTSFGSGMGIAGSGSDTATGMGLSMDGRMNGAGGGMSIVNSGSDRMGLGMDRMNQMSEMGGTTRRGMGGRTSGQDMSGGVGSDLGGRTFGRDMAIGTQGSDMSGMGERMRGGIPPMRGMGGDMEMAGRMGGDMVSRMSAMSGMGRRMGVTGSEMTRGMAGIGERVNGMRGSIGTAESGMGPGMGSRMLGMGEGMPGSSGGTSGLGSGVSGIGGGMSGMGGAMSGIGGAMTGMGRTMTGMGGSVPGMGGGESSFGGGMSGMAGRVSGMGGAVPSMGSGMPGMGGATPSMGGAMPGMGGAMPGMGGAMPGMGGAMPSMGGAMPGIGGAMSGMGVPGSEMMGRGRFMGGARGVGGPGFDRSRMGPTGSPMRDPRMGPGFGPGRPGMGPGPGTMIGGPGMRPGPGPMGPGLMPPFMRRGMPPFMGRGPMRRGMMGFRRRR